MESPRRYSRKTEVARLYANSLKLDEIFPIEFEYDREGEEFQTLLRLMADFTFADMAEDQEEGGPYVSP